MPTSDRKWLHIVSTVYGFVLVFPTEASLSGTIDHLAGMLAAKRARVMPVGHKNYAAYLVASDRLPTKADMENLLNGIVQVSDADK